MSVDPQFLKAARWNIEHNSITNITVARLSSEDFSQAYTGVRDFFRLSSQGIRLSEYDFGTSMRGRSPCHLVCHTPYALRQLVMLSMSQLFPLSLRMFKSVKVE